jgi:hypothetical protein
VQRYLDSLPDAAYPEARRKPECVMQEVMDLFNKVANSLALLQCNMELWEH